MQFFNAVLIIVADRSWIFGYLGIWSLFALVLQVVFNISWMIQYQRSFFTIFIIKLKICKRIRMTIIIFFYFIRGHRNSACKCWFWAVWKTIGKFVWVFILWAWLKGIKFHVFNAFFNIYWTWTVVTSFLLWELGISDNFYWISLLFNN